MRESAEDQFLYHLFEVTGKFPDDPSYENINPYLKVWLFESWVAKQEREAKFERDLAIFLGSFYNPEAAQQITKRDNPDFVSTDFEKTANELDEEIKKEESSKRKKKRRAVKD